jgi:hypothetical protein
MRLRVARDSTERSEFLLSQPKFFSLFPQPRTNKFHRSFSAESSDHPPS